MKLPAYVACIWNQSLNGVIGRDNTIPEEFQSDLSYFRQQTLGATVVMGRKTWESLPFKPLSKRINVVLTRDPDLQVPDSVIKISSLDQLDCHTDKLFFIGGQEIYRMALPYCTHLHITTQLRVVTGDTYAPDFSQINQDFVPKQVLKEPGLNYRIDIYERKRHV